MIFQSTVMNEVREDLLKIARSDCTVLMTGETGTGKEVAAEFIHENSPRRRGAFITVNCAAIPENLLETELFGHEKGAFTGAALTKRGKFEIACGGTVFLDEIGDMSLYTQPKILRVIEKKQTYRLGGTRSIPIDVRYISATNKDPEKLVEEGTFREDLFYRLNVTRVHIPPLRDRIEDIPPLVEHFVSRFNRRYDREIEGLTEEALDVMLRYDWPGNIRELRNVIEASFVNLPFRRITTRDFPKHFIRRLNDGKEVVQTERNRLLTALCSTNWNKSRAAAKLNWSRTKVYRKLRKYHIVEKGLGEERPVSDKIMH
jgi:two-component system response regulator HydG/two-component system response regulator AtoC